MCFNGYHGVGERRASADVLAMVFRVFAATNRGVTWVGPAAGLGRTQEQARIMRKGLGLVFAVAIMGLLSGPAFGGAMVLDHTVEDIDGKEVDLSEYKGKVVMLVNVASKCGLTPQYEQLVEIHEKYADQGFTVLGFPANDFLKQEPGTNAEIKEFCSTNFGVDFPMFSKIVVKGEGQNPLYQELTSEEANGELGGEIAWNFTKFLVNKDGEVVARFEPRTKPDAEEVIAKIEEELAKS